MRRFLIWVTPLLVVATPAAAQQASTDTVAAAPAPTPAAAPAKPKKVCRTQQITGRRIAQTQCYTAAQWAEYDRVQAEAAQRFASDVNAHNAKASLGGGGTGGLSTSSIFGLAPPQ